MVMLGDEVLYRVQRRGGGLDPKWVVDASVFDSQVTFETKELARAIQCADELTDWFGLEGFDYAIFSMVEAGVFESMESV